VYAGNTTEERILAHDPVDPVASNDFERPRRQHRERSRGWARNEVQMNISLAIRASTRFHVGRQYVVLVRVTRELGKDLASRPSSSQRWIRRVGDVEKAWPQKASMLVRQVACRRVKPARDSFLVFGAPKIDEDEISEVVDSLRSGWVGTGPKVARFERALEEYVGAPHVRCVSSCTAALMLALKALGIGPGDEVIVPTMTFVASANAVEHSGAVPVFVDCDTTGNLDLTQARDVVTARTKAIMPVHMAGRPVDLDAVGELARGHDIAVIEDAAHAIGAEWHGRRIGASGNLVAFSFYVTKNVTTIEGGALATPDVEIAQEVERLALHGLSLGAWQRFSDPKFKHYDVVEPGFKFNMTDVQAAVGLHQLPRLDAWIDRREQQWLRYDEQLEPLPLDLPAVPERDTRHARHLYQVAVRDEAGISRDELAGRLTQQMIGIGVHYRAVHLHPFYRERYSLSPDRFPVATRLSEQTLSLPLGPAVSDRDQDDVIAALHHALAH
jgi:dTDP-4-amino-4,6-dideoxygalactose transaminase